ncbi:MAG: hypothetical protein ACTSWZ_00365 [Candidatus Heimdallarchaeaceae archaeon]
MALIHSSYFRPKVNPVKSDENPTEIDRLQDFTGTITLNRTKIEEIGREGIVDWRKTSPEVSLTLRQLEYGSLEMYNQLANKSLSSTKVELKEFKTSMVDIAGYKTDDDGNFVSTIWYPKFRLSGISLAIGDPDALLERTFTLVGEDEITLKNNNKYLIFKKTNPSEGQDQTITISDPTVVADPDNSGAYLFRVGRIRSGTYTELTHGTDWSCDGTDLTINGQSYSSDVIKYVYSASSYISGEEPFVANDSDAAGLTADSCSIYLIDTSNYIYKLQSVGVDITFDRFDTKEIGSKEVVARGIRDTTVRITLGRILHQWTLEEILRGVAGLDFGKIDIRKFQDELTLLIKVYTDNTKNSFAIGYKFIGLAPVGLDAGVPLNDYVTRGVSLEGESGSIVTDENLL